PAPALAHDRPLDAPQRPSLAPPPRPALDATRLSNDNSFRADDPLATRLNHHPSIRSDLTTAASTPLRTRGYESRDASHAQRHLPGEGDRVGRFIVLRELGRGAMGVVYAAFDEELARRVAVKLLHFVHGVDASTGRSQLLREAQALARLTHPNVVGVYEAGVWQGSVYVAMEYVQGVDLQAWLAAERRPWRETLAVLRQAGDGLYAAHRSGLVHRDFKPSNVLVGDDGRARVADFGLAARRGEPAPGDDEISAVPSLLTSTIAGEGALVGTPAYMAPEQVRRGEATAYSDQFAYGVALYEALYGARPFRGDDFAALAHAIQHSDPPPPPPGSPVPPWLFPLVLRCLAKDPDRRWPNLADLLAELARDPEAERHRRRRLTLQLLATMTLTVLAIVGSVRLYAILARHNAERRADERLAELREQLAQPRVKTTPGEAERLIAAFAAYPDNRGTAAVARAHLERASELADPAAAVDAYAGAFLTATDPGDEIAALRGLIPRLVAAGRHVEAGEALTTLDRRAPELAHDPDLALARRTAALRCRNLPAARAALDVLPADDPLRSYAAVLDNLSRATVLDPAQFGGLHHEFHLYTTADLDGDGRPELATATPGRARDSFAIFAGTAGLPLLGRFASGQPALQNVSLLPTGHADGPLLFTAAAIAGKPQLFRYALSEPLQDGSVAERLVFEDAHNLVAAAADLDHDGHPELYLGTGAYTRHLLRADRGPTGAFTLHSPSPSLDRLASDLSALAGGDLDGDGHDELVVAAGPWRAFDLRILRRRADGELVTVARQSLGMLRSLQLVRVGDELWIAAAKQDNYASPTRFSARAPFGPPAGLNLFALRHETLVQTGFHPTADLPGVEHLDFPMLVADLDGDRHDDILVRASDPEAGRSNLVVYRQHAGNFLPPLVIHGIEPRALLEQDDDPSPELLATDSRASPQETLILGLGDAPLRPLAVPRDAERPVPAGLDEPALAAAWRRTEEMVAIGLPHRSAVELSALAGPAGHVREDLFLRAGELFARAGDHAAAAERFIAAAERPALAAEALAGAIRSRRALGDIAGETALAERRVALPDLAPEPRAAAEAELAVLRRAVAPRPQLALRFDRPLDPRWQLHDPLRLARDPSRQALRISSGPTPPVATLPLRHAGGTIVVTLALEVELAEWGSEVGVHLLAGDTLLAGLLVSGRGGTDNPDFFLSSITDDITLPRPPTGQIRLRHAIYPELRLAVLTLEIPGRPALLRSYPLDRALPERLTLRLAANTILPPYFTRAYLHTLELEGLEIDDAALPTPDHAGARALVEGEHLAALASLPATQDLPPGDPRLLWRSVLLARLDQQDPAADALRRALAVPEDSPIHAALTNLLQQGEPLWISAVRRALGPRSVRYRFPVGLLQHPWRPGSVALALAELATWPRAPDPAATPQQLADHVLALAMRGAAWQNFGRLDLARQDLAAAASIADRPGVAVEDRLLLDMRAAQLAIAAKLGDRVDGLAIAARMFPDALSPQIFLERLQNREDLAALFTPEDWATLAALAHE
ncbi:MAG: serine/threonine protein kinase, partial [Myxococcales bacterium]|nr:serine/threonine protein kinase [Myxococcales bacterium]